MTGEAEGPRRLLVHAGLPEGGPGAVTRFLSANREALAPAADLVLPAQLAEPARAAAHFAQHAQALALADLADGLSAAIPATLGAAGRDAVLACTALSGAVAGGAGGAHGAHGAAPALAAVVAGFLQERFPRADLRLVLTTDAAWVRRAWAHRLVTGRLRLPLAAFAARVAGPGPEAAVAAVAEAVAEVAPRAECFVLALGEAGRHPLGAGGAVLELLDLPEPLRASLRAVQPARLPDAGLAAELLRLNASDLPDGRVRADKRALLDERGFPLWARLLSP